MFLASENVRKTSADFTRHFDFLTKEFGVKFFSENYSIIGGDTYTRILRNEYVQVELYGDQSYFHLKIRRMVDGEPRPYEDNNISLGRLAVTVHGEDYKYAEFYPAIVGWERVLENTAILFKSSKDLFTSGNWDDIGNK